MVVEVLRSGVQLTSYTAEWNIDAIYVKRQVQISAEMPAGFKSRLFTFDWFRDTKGKPLAKSLRSRLLTTPLP